MTLAAERMLPDAKLAEPNGDSGSRHLLAAQRVYRLDLQRSARRKKRCQQGDRQEQQRNTQETQWIERRQPVQEGARPFRRASFTWASRWRTARRRTTS